MFPRNVNILKGLESKTGLSRITNFLHHFSPATVKLIEQILESVDCLTPIEKLLLYLKLPTHRTISREATSESEASIADSSSAVNWIKTHLQENADTSVSKQNVYNEYSSFCKVHNLSCATVVEFGQLLRSYFPNVKMRRLGKRGSPKCVYGGISFLDRRTPGGIPEIIVPSSTSPSNTATDDIDEDSGEALDQDHSLAVTSSAHSIILEWAEKLLETPFVNVCQLATHLVEKNYVNTFTSDAIIVRLSSTSTFVDVDLTHPADSLVIRPSSSSDGSSRDDATQRRLVTKDNLLKVLQKRSDFKQQKTRMEQGRIEVTQKDAACQVNIPATSINTGTTGLAAARISIGDGPAARSSTGTGLPARVCTANGQASHSSTESVVALSAERKLGGSKCIRQVSVPKLILPKLAPATASVFRPGVVTICTGHPTTGNLSSLASNLTPVRFQSVHFPRNPFSGTFSGSNLVGTSTVSPTGARVSDSKVAVLLSPPQLISKQCNGTHVTTAQSIAQPITSLHVGQSTIAAQFNNGMMTSKDIAQRRTSSKSSSPPMTREIVQPIKTQHDIRRASEILTSTSVSNVNNEIDLFPVLSIDDNNKETILFPVSSAKDVINRTILFPVSSTSAFDSCADSSFAVFRSGSQCFEVPVINKTLLQSLTTNAENIKRTDNSNASDHLNESLSFTCNSNKINNSVVAANFSKNNSFVRILSNADLKAPAGSNRDVASNCYRTVFNQTTTGNDTRGSVKTKTGKKKRTPSKSVFSLLCEQRKIVDQLEGDNNFFKDNRPVSELLRECRELQKRQRESQGQVGSPMKEILGQAESQNHDGQGQAGFQKYEGQGQAGFQKHEGKGQAGQGQAGFQIKGTGQGRTECMKLEAQDQEQLQKQAIQDQEPLITWLPNDEQSSKKRESLASASSAECDTTRYRVNDRTSLMTLAGVCSNAKPTHLDVDYYNLQQTLGGQQSPSDRSKSTSCNVNQFNYTPSNVYPVTACNNLSMKNVSPISVYSNLLQTMGTVRLVNSKANVVPIVKNDTEQTKSNNNGQESKCNTLSFNVRSSFPDLKSVLSDSISTLPEISDQNVQMLWPYTFKKPIEISVSPSGTKQVEMNTDQLKESLPNSSIIKSTNFVTRNDGASNSMLFKLVSSSTPGNCSPNLRMNLSSTSYVNSTPSVKFSCSSVNSSSAPSVKLSSNLDVNERYAPGMKLSSLATMNSSDAGTPDVKLSSIQLSSVTGMKLSSTPGRISSSVLGTKFSSASPMKVVMPTTTINRIHPLLLGMSDPAVSASSSASHTVRCQTREKSIISGVLQSSGLMQLLATESNTVQSGKPIVCLPVKSSCTDQAIHNNFNSGSKRKHDELVEVRRSSLDPAIKVLKLADKFETVRNNCSVQSPNHRGLDPGLANGYRGIFDKNFLSSENAIAPVSKQSDHHSDNHYTLQQLLKTESNSPVFREQLQQEIILQKELLRREQEQLFRSVAHRTAAVQSGTNVTRLSHVSSDNLTSHSSTVPVFTFDRCDVSLYGKEGASVSCSSLGVKSPLTPFVPKSPMSANLLSPDCRKFVPVRIHDSPLNAQETVKPTATVASNHPVLQSKLDAVKTDSGISSTGKFSPSLKSCFLRLSNRMNSFGRQSLRDVKSKNSLLIAALERGNSSSAIEPTYNQTSISAVHSRSRTTVRASDQRALGFAPASSIPLPLKRQHGDGAPTRGGGRLRVGGAVSGGGGQGHPSGRQRHHSAQDTSQMYYTADELQTLLKLLQATDQAPPSLTDQAPPSLTDQAHPSLTQSTPHTLSSFQSVPTPRTPAYTQSLSTLHSHTFTQSTPTPQALISTQSASTPHTPRASTYTQSAPTPHSLTSNQSTPTPVECVSDTASFCCPSPLSSELEEINRLVNYRQYAYNDDDMAHRSVSAPFDWSTSFLSFMDTEEEEEDLIGGMGLMPRVDPPLAIHCPALDSTRTLSDGVEREMSTPPSARIPSQLLSPLQSDDLQGGSTAADIEEGIYMSTKQGTLHTNADLITEDESVIDSLLSSLANGE